MEYPAKTSPQKNPPPTPAEITALYQKALILYGTRNAEYFTLREAFDGEYVSVQEDSAVGRQTPFANEPEIVYNMVNAGIRRYMDEMSAGFRIECLPRGVDEADLALADKRTKWCQEVAADNEMLLMACMAAYDQGLLDKAVWHIRPAPQLKMGLKVSLIVPETYMPIPEKNDWRTMKCALIVYEEYEEGELQWDPDGRNWKSQGQNVTHVEYWSKDYFARIRLSGIPKKVKNVDGSWRTVNETDLSMPTYSSEPIKHGFGYIPIAEQHNLPIPARQRGQGDADQIVGLNVYLNRLFSDAAAIIDYAASPIIVVQGVKTGTNLLFAPRAIWELERDGSAQILQWQGSPPSFEAQILRTMQGIEDGLGMGGPVFGRELPSGVSGSAVRAITAGFGSRVGTKQTMAALALTRIFEWAQQMAEKEFPNRAFELSGESVMGDGPPPVFKPGEMKGWYRVKIEWEPQDKQTQTFMELEKHRQGLQSRYTTMRNIGIRSPGDEWRRILIERQIDLEFKAKEAMLLQAAQPRQLEDQSQAERPGMAEAQRASEEALQALRQRAGRGLDLAGLLGGGGNAPEAPESGSSADEGPSVRVGREDLLSAIQSAGPSGGVQLTGQIAMQGYSDDVVSLNVSNPADIEKLRAVLEPRYGARFSYNVVQGSPNGQPAGG